MNILSLFFLTTINASKISDEIIVSLITAIISILGFIITYVSLKKSFKNELKKQRDSVALEKMSTMPYEVLNLFEQMKNTNNETSVRSRQERINADLQHFGEIMNTIYSYGSEQAIKIVSTMQKENYQANGNSSRLDKYRVMCLYVLLATQIKYDVTEIAVSPQFWFEMRINDFTDNQIKIKNANNKLVKELKLNNQFIIPD